MTGYPTIVVAAGLDERDATTLRHAAHFARMAPAHSVYVAHVAASFDLPEELAKAQPAPLTPVDEDIEQRLRALVDAHPGLFPALAQVHCVARQGSLVPELVRLTAQKSADLLCLSRQPHQEHDLLSDSALTLVRKTPCSVLVIPAGTPPQYQRILVPVDFSDSSRKALDAACAIAQATPGAVVTVYHAYELPLGWYKGGRSYEEFTAIMRGHAERHWREFLATVDTRGVPVEARLELSDKLPVTGTILAAADEVDADLLVLGSHGRTRPAAVLLGHVADTVCARTVRPILCVKKKGQVVNFLHALLQFFDFESA